MTKADRLSCKSSIKWIRAYLECLFESRPVYIFPAQAKQLELFLI